MKRKVVFIMNSDKNAELIKNIIEKLGKPSSVSAINENDIREKIKTVDKQEVIKKLNSMGLGSIAQKLKNMSDEEIINAISKNPSILKKLNTILKGGR